MSSHPRRFTAVTWNVYHGTPRHTLEPVLERLIHHRGVSLVYGQEMARAEHRHMLRDAGLEVAFAPRQYVMAWDPHVWEAEGTSECVRLGETAYYRRGGHEPQFSEAVMQRLRHLRTGKVLAGMSYHAPSHVQVADQPPRRIEALRETAASWHHLSIVALRHGADAALFAGDDNVDERLRHGPWRFMLRGATGLRQVQAPRGTHGKVRRIDDFRVRGDLHVGRGWTMPVPAPDDHDIHGRTFRWR